MPPRGMAADECCWQPPSSPPLLGAGFLYIRVDNVRLWLDSGPLVIIESLSPFTLEPPLLHAEDSIVGETIAIIVDTVAGFRVARVSGVILWGTVLEVRGGVIVVVGVAQVSQSVLVPVFLVFISVWMQLSSASGTPSLSLSSVMPLVESQRSPVPSSSVSSRFSFSTSGQLSKRSGWESSSEFTAGKRASKPP